MNTIEKIRNKKKKMKGEHFFDYTLLFVVLFLVGFGLIMIYSTSSYDSKLATGNPAYYLQRQGVAAILGIGAMILVSFFPYRVLEKFTGWYYLIGIVFLLLLLTPLAHSAKGATRWIKLGFGFNLQPAEIAKLCMILFLAGMVCKMGSSLKTWKGFLIMLAFPIPMCAMIYIISDNLSSAIIVFGIAILMIFVASPDYKKISLVLATGAALVGGVIFYVYNFVSMDTKQFRLRRILAWFEPEAFAQDEGFQTLQSLYAIGSGGVFGKGLGQSMQKLGYIPEAQNDMIFSIICEELGLFGAVMVIVLFLLLIWRCMIIATNAEDMYGALIVVGVMGHFAIQVILNIAVVTNTIPNTGITLPFISYGGSSTGFLLIEIGLVLSVARGIRIKTY